MPPASSPADPSLTDWMQGLGTTAGAIVAVLALVAAILAYRAQNKQLKHQQDQIAAEQALNQHQGRVLELQAAELRQSLQDRARDAQALRRAQVAQVFIEIERYRAAGGAGYAVSTVTNTSSQPIYDLHLRWWGPNGEYIAPKR